MTTIKPEVQITRKCLAQVRTRVAVADLAFTSSECADVLSFWGTVFTRLNAGPRINAGYKRENCK